MSFAASGLQVQGSFLSSVLCGVLHQNVTCLSLSNFQSTEGITNDIENPSEKLKTQHIIYGSIVLE